MNVHVRELTIGALAKAAGVSTPTIRYYEEIGLLPSPNRTSAGQRFYAQADLSRLTFIKQCRDFGFGIDQVRMLLALSISPDRDCVETRNIAQAHLDAVRKKLAELHVLESRIRGFVDSCNAACIGGPANVCTITRDITAAPVSGKGCCG
jgi:MerR family copper efflux transcriptional regulator